MFRLDNILERWAVVYAPMRHNPGAKAAPEDRTFFRIDRMELENEFSRTCTYLKRPCLCFCVNFDSRLDGPGSRFALHHYQLYICKKQGGGSNYASDDRGAADAKCDLNDLTEDLMAFLFALQDAVGGKSFRADVPQDVRDIYDHLSDEDRMGIRGLRLEETQWWSVPRYKNGWWIMGIELFGLSPRQLCIVPSRYVSALPDDSPTPPAAPPRRGRKQ